MGGASSSAGAAGAAGAASSGATTNAAAGAGASQNMTQQYMQKYGYNPYEMAGKYVSSAFDKAGEGFANQKNYYSPQTNSPQFSYSPDLNKPIFAQQDYNFGLPQNFEQKNRGMFYGTDFANQAQRKIGI